MPDDYNFLLVTNKSSPGPESFCATFQILKKQKPILANAEGCFCLFVFARDAKGADLCKTREDIYKHCLD